MDACEDQEVDGAYVMHWRDLGRPLARQCHATVVGTRCETAANAGKRPIDALIVTCRKGRARAELTELTWSKR